MPKTTRNALLIFGVIFSLLLIALRISNQFGLSDDMRIFSGVLGYEGTKSYAVFLFDEEKDPVLFQFTLSKGEVAFTSVTEAKNMLAGLQNQSLAKSADVLIKRIIETKKLNALDAIGFVKSDAAQELADAFGGFYLEDELIKSQNLNTLVWGAALSKHATDTFNNSISFSKKNVLTRSRIVLSAVKTVFSKKWVAVYFRDENTFGKQCLGACDITHTIPN